ncbi:MAG: xanthine dehydrogenase family protein molybdopterin-binding subunit, partial [Thermoleophilia bacterium]|nr:xanthine dehydrogenase family protein molybdopterin-binding subunit [Thermoleophilia bacterium]
MTTEGPEITPTEHRRFTRSAFLKGGGALIVVIGLPAAVWGFSRDGAEVPTSWPETLDPSSLDSWLAIRSDGTVTAFTGKTELGQGNRTALSQIVAEELDVPFDRIEMVMGDTATCVDQGSTVGSRTIALAGPQLRQAAAEGRRALLALAATHLDVPAGRLRVEDGVVEVTGDASRRVSYGDLVGDRLLGVTVPVKGDGAGFALELGGAEPKRASEYTIVGRSVPRVDIPPKVTGEHYYIQDVRVPDMLHGRVIRPPALGSQLLSHGEPSHGARVVRRKNFLGVVAEREWDAIRAARDLEVKWSDWAGLPAMDEIYSYVRETPSLEDKVVASTGDAAKALASASRRLEASYTTAVQTHGSIGPSCAVADWQDRRLVVWSGTQNPHWMRRDLALLMAMPEDEIVVERLEA